MQYFCLSKSEKIALILEFWRQFVSRLSPRPEKTNFAQFCNPQKSHISKADQIDILKINFLCIKSVNDELYDSVTEWLAKIENDIRSYWF